MAAVVAGAAVVGALLGAAAIDDVPAAAMALDQLPVDDSDGGRTAPDEATASLLAAASAEPVEVLGERTESTSVFAMPDGTYALRISGGPVWARIGGDGSREEDWTPVDLTLVAGDDGMVRPVAHPAGLEFSGAGDGAALASLTYDGVDFGFSWDGPLPTPRLDGPRAVYEDVLPGIDMILEATGSGFEQFFVIRERPTGALTLPVDVWAEGADLQPNDDGGIDFLDAAGSPVASVPTPLMWDVAADEQRGIPVTAPWPSEAEAAVPRTLSAADLARGLVDRDKVDVDDLDKEHGESVLPGLGTDGASGGRGPEAGPTRGRPDIAEVARGTERTGQGRMRLSLAPQMSFLQDPETEYPVVVDPSVNTVTLTPVFDTSVQSGITYDLSGNSELFVGSWNAGATKTRSWVRFTTPSLAGKHILQADLYLYNHWSYSCNKRTWEVHRSGSPTTSTRWTNQPALYEYQSGRYTANGYSSSCPADWQSTDVTDGVKTTIGAGSTYTSFRISAANESDSYSWKRFRSSEYSAARPQLVVYWTNFPDTPTDAELSPVLAVDGDLSYVGTPVPSAQELKLEDFDGDGRTDVLWFTGSGWNLAVGQEDGTFGSWTRAFASIRTPLNSELELGDFNGDGRTDVICFTGTKWDVALGQADGTFTGWVSALGSVTRPSTHELRLGDVNGDARTDVIWFTGSAWQVARAQSGGTFLGWLEATPSVIKPSTHDVALSDVSGDARTDVIWFTGTNGWQVKLGLSDGHFSGWVGTSSTVHPSTHELRLGDVTGDSRIDAVHFTGSGWEVARGQSNGTFASWVAASTNTERPSTDELDLGDFDGDGRGDVIHFTGSGWDLAQGQADGTFAAWSAASDNAERPSAHELAFGDFDGDGATDVLRLRTDGWGLARGQSDGTFASWLDAGATIVRAPTLSATVSDPEGGTMYAVFEVRIDEAQVAIGQVTTTSGARPSWVVPEGVLAPGVRYTFRVQAWDDAGSKSQAWSPDVAFTVGVPTGAPLLARTTSPESPCVTGSTRPAIGSATPTLRSLITDPDPGNLRAEFSVYDAATQALVWGPALTTARAAGAEHTVTIPAGLLADGGTYEWRVHGIGPEGSVGPAVSCEFTVDLQAPAEPGVSPVAGQPAVYAEDQASGGVGLAGQFELSDGGATDVVAFHYSLGDDSFRSSVLAASPVIDFTPTRAGVHVLYVRSVDAAGWVSPVRVYRFTVAGS